MFLHSFCICFFFRFREKKNCLSLFAAIQPYAHFAIYNKQRIIFSLAVQFHFNTGAIFIRPIFSLNIYAFGNCDGVCVCFIFWALNITHKADKFQSKKANKWWKPISAHEKYFLCKRLQSLARSSDLWLDSSFFFIVVVSVFSFILIRAYICMCSVQCRDLHTYCPILTTNGKWAINNRKCRKKYQHQFSLKKYDKRQS